LGYSEEVTAIFGPQHGFYQTEQDNMKVHTGS